MKKNIYQTTRQYRFCEWNSILNAFGHVINQMGFISMIMLFIAIAIIQFDNWAVQFSLLALAASAQLAIPDLLDAGFKRIKGINESKSGYALLALAVTLANGLAVAAGWTFMTIPVS